MDDIFDKAYGQAAAQALFETIIKDHYAIIIKKIKDGQIYGRKIDLDNHEQVVVAAYLMGGINQLGLWSHIIYDEKES